MFTTAYNFILIYVCQNQRYSHGRLDSVQEFNEIQGWLLLTFFICLHNQLSFFNSIIVQMSEECDSSNRQ